MQYRKDRYGEPISLLGYGCMRFTKNGNSIDLDKAERELMLAIKSGVNYLDTAYIYPGSEVAVGEILHRNHCREEIRLATKLPQYYIKSGAAIEKYFNDMFDGDVKVGQIKTCLAIKGKEQQGPKAAALDLFEIIKEL